MLYPYYPLFPLSLPNTKYITLIKIVINANIFIQFGSVVIVVIDIFTICAIYRNAILNISKNDIIILIRFLIVSINHLKPLTIAFILLPP